MQLWTQELKLIIECPKNIQILQGEFPQGYKTI